MFGIDISTSGNGDLNKLAARLSDLGPPLAETGAYLERKAKLRFVSETAPDGRKWAALRPSTLRYKKTKAILRETGAMAASIAFIVGRDSVRVKPSVDYAIFHQLGTKRMVARPILGFEADDPQRIAQIFADYLEG